MKYSLTITASDDADGMSAIRRAMTADSVYSVLWDYDQWLRRKIKYEEKPEATLEEARTQLRELMEARGVSLDDYT